MISDRRKEIFRRSLGSGLLYVVRLFFLIIIFTIYLTEGRERKIGREGKVGKANIMGDRGG